MTMKTNLQSTILLIDNELEVANLYQRHLKSEPMECFFVRQQE